MSAAVRTCAHSTMASCVARWASRSSSVAFLRFRTKLSLSLRQVSIRCLWFSSTALHVDSCDETGLVFELSQAEVNTFTEPILANFIAGTGKNISYGITNPNGQFYIPLFTSSQTVGFGAA